MCNFKVPWAIHAHNYGLIDKLLPEASKEPVYSRDWKVQLGEIWDISHLKNLEQ